MLPAYYGRENGTSIRRRKAGECPDAKVRRPFLPTSAFCRPQPSADPSGVRLALERTADDGKAPACGSSGTGAGLRRGHRLPSTQQRRGDDAKLDPKITAELRYASKPEGVRHLFDTARGPEQLPRSQQAMLIQPISRRAPEGDGKEALQVARRDAQGARELSRVVLTARCQVLEETAQRLVSPRNSAPRARHRDGDLRPGRLRSGNSCSGNL